MRVGTPGFVPDRLVEARSARRISSQKALASLISVTPGSVSKWESGLMRLTQRRLLRSPINYGCGVSIFCALFIRANADFLLVLCPLRFSVTVIIKNRKCDGCRRYLR